MKSLLAAVAILTAALSFRVGMSMSEAAAHVAPAAFAARRRPPRPTATASGRA